VYKHREETDININLVNVHLESNRQQITAVSILKKTFPKNRLNGVWKFSGLNVNPISYNGGTTNIRYDTHRHINISWDCNPDFFPVLGFIDPNSNYNYN
jgi:hypothetical protein